MFIRKAFNNDRFFFIISVFLLFIICWIIYGDTLGNPYMLDDLPFLRSSLKEIYPNFSSYFVNNKHHHYSPIYYAVNTYLFEHFSDNRQLLHLTNVILFYVSGVLYFLLIRSLIRNQAIALLASVWFCLHPINSFTVTQITCNFTFISSIMLEICLLVYLKYIRQQEKNTAFLFAGLAAFIISALTFEGALVLPLMIVMVNYFIQNKTFKRSLLSAAPFFIAAILYFLFWATQAGKNAGLLYHINNLDIHLGNYGATVLLMVGWYILNLLSGYDIAIIRNFFPVRDFAWGWSLVLVLIVFLVGRLLFKIWKKDIKSFALVWFLLGLPLAAVASVFHSDMGFVWQPHWLYFTSMGFFLLLSIIVYEWKQKVLKAVWWGGIISLMIFYGVLTQSYNVLGKSEKGFCHYWLKSSPGNIIAALRLGEIYYEEGNREKALYFLAMAAEKYTIPKMKAQLLHNMGIIYAETNQKELAEKYFQEAIKVMPDYVHSYIALGKYYLSLKDYEKAQTYLTKAIEFDPQNEYVILLRKKLQQK